MITIQKFNLGRVDWRFTLDMPRGAKILTVGIDKNTGSRCIWAMINHDSPAEPRNFEVILTGEELEDYTWDSHVYIGTFKEMSHVYHLFEKVK